MFIRYKFKQLGLGLMYLVFFLMTCLHWEALIDAESGKKLNEILRQLGSDEILGRCGSTWRREMSWTWCSNEQNLRLKGKDWLGLAFRFVFLKWTRNSVRRNIIEIPYIEVDQIDPGTILRHLTSWGLAILQMWRRIWRQGWKMWNTVMWAKPNLWRP